MSRYWGYSQRPSNWKELLQEVPEIVPEILMPEKPEVEVPEKPEVMIPEKIQDDTPRVDDTPQVEQPKTDSSSTYL